MTVERMKSTAIPRWHGTSAGAFLFETGVDAITSPLVNTADRLRITNPSVNGRRLRHPQLNYQTPASRSVLLAPLTCVCGLVVGRSCRLLEEQACARLEGHVVPDPFRHHANPAAKTDQEKNMNDAPEQPCEKP